VRKNLQHKNHLCSICLLVVVVINEPDGTHPVDQVLVDFYTSLSNRGVLKWDTAWSMCGQQGLYCENGKVVVM